MESPPASYTARWDWATYSGPLRNEHQRPRNKVISSLRIRQVRGQGSDADLGRGSQALEGGVGCVATSTGMSAVHCAMALFSPGDHIVAPADLYGGTFRLFDKFLKEKGISFTFVDMTDLGQVAAAFTPATRGVWIETPSNPLLKVIDLAGVVQLARNTKCL